MKKLTISIGTVLSLLLAVVVAAAPPLETATLDTPGTTRTLLLPPAADNSNVISLGTAVDPGTGKVVEGLAIIHRKDNAIKPGGARPSNTACYTYLAKGAKWKNVEPWLVNPSNIDGLANATVFNLLSGGVSKWEDATDGNVTNGAGIDVLGVGTITSATLSADTLSLDNQNEVYFADIVNSNTIAVTIVWGIFGGPISGRQLVEWDQVYDDVTFDWSAEGAGVAGKMDFDNIATHENGHAAGMGHPSDSCTEETMYRFSPTAEIQKRDLNPGDITGVNALY